MTDTQQRAAAKAFAKNWKDRGYEKGDSQIFWVELLTTVFGVTEISQFISFEDQVHLDHTSFIDGYIEKTHVMIEQKSINKSLTAAIRQSDGSMLTPFEQAKRYSSELPYSKRPRWIVTSNFQSFYIYDMEKPGGDPEIIQLEDLEKEYYRLQFLVDEGNTNLQREMEVSIAAGEIVGLLYDALAKQYVDPTTERAMKSLNILCVRMVFCLYAEDAGIFGQHGMFHDYLEEFDTRHMRKAVIELFQVLDTKPEDRDPYIEESLAQFPYVNGGLFANEDIEIPQFTDEIRNLLLEKASADFDWSEISPTIFGAVFESTLNPETRRSGGMHYTSIENIHKVIDPLFLDDLKNELKEIQQITVQRTKDKKLRDFQTKLSNLRWLDPASGSGNFLTETYISIRRLENEVIKELQRGQITFGFDESSPIHVSIDQFYGIEINDFAVTVAKTALWIAESQMMKETEDIVHMNLDFLPLTTNAFIVEGNSLQIDWESVVPKNQVSYIMGNPPFHGFTFMTAEQKQDMQNIFPGVKNLDFVCAWYKKASDYIRGTKIEVAFVSTNSIVQGETVSRFWDFEIFVGSDSAFEKIVPKSARNLSEMAAKLDDGNKKMDVFVNIPGQPEPKPKKKKKPRVQDFVIHADEYCSVQEHVIINFINFIFQMSITNMYIQNPPKSIREQIYRTFNKSIIHETQQPYLEVSKEMIQTFNSQYSERIIGQERAKKKLLQAIYPLVDGKQSKPVVILLYGDSGLGKTESAQYMAELMGGKLLRKQFSMYQNNESANYIFGGRYNEKSFAQDLLARETNVLLFDEFDKALSIFHSAFYQLFDEGIYEDHNYKVVVNKAIIMCTSNYKTIDEIKEHLGLPIYNRFDSIIKFNDLSGMAKEKIAEREIERLREDYDIEDRELFDKIKKGAVTQSNAREIKHLIKDTFSLVALNKICGETEI